MRVREVRVDQTNSARSRIELTTNVMDASMTATVDFWFDFASTYSYLSAMRIAPLAAERGVAIAWRPFLLGPIFKSQGWTTSPFNIYPVKGRYMVRDIERIAAARGLSFSLPDPFPQASLAAARVAAAIEDAGARAAFSRAVFEAEFAEGADISSRDVINRCLILAQVPPEDILSAAESDGIKLRLREETDEAMRLGVFGAPAFIARDGELFWGDDRLEWALDHAVRLAQRNGTVHAV